MGVVSQLILGGYNEVMVAANTVVFGEFLMVVARPARARAARRGVVPPALAEAGRRAARAFRGR